MLRHGNADCGHSHILYLEYVKRNTQRGSGKNLIQFTYLAEFRRTRLYLAARNEDLPRTRAEVINCRVR